MAFAHPLLQQDIKYLKGVGPQRAATLAKELHVFSLRDLLYTFPYRHIDRTVVHRIRDLQDDMPLIQLRGRIVNIEHIEQGKYRRLVATFFDGSGYMELVWFNSIKTMQKNLRMDMDYLILGKPQSFNGRFSIVHPEMEKADDAKVAARRMQPVYHTTEGMKRAGISSKTLEGLVENAFATIGNHIEETLPPYLIQKQALLDLPTALRRAHFPEDAASLPAAMHRLKFEELFYLQLDILRYAKNRKLNIAGYPFPKVGEAFMTFFRERLPFELTGAQKRVVKEIRNDMRTGRQMNRLLQGDVGSGKTMVALMCCLIAVDNGFQACLMAPTEILAEQHLASLRNFLGDMTVRVELLTGNVKGVARRKILDGVASGEVNILVGTHALIEPTVQFLNLGLAVIDEQHRFGVKQRARLWEKNARPPHVLVMTATPIPRTLAMTVYGDLDVSVIDELPPGRKPIQTLHFFHNNTERLYAGMRRELQLGRQIYVVYPLIEESEKIDLKNLEEGAEIFAQAFPEYRIGRVHGKMKPAEKDAAMQEFSTRKTHILVSTTVIEVGVNVPNASVMVIMDASRFGLSQLHQLRGRVGRGADQSYCILVTDYKLSETTRKRMDIMTATTDGFEIAEEDLKLRGPGDLEGTAQSGLPFDLKVANVVRDSGLMTVARLAAEDLLAADPYEQLPQHAMIWEQLRQLRGENKNFSAIS